jgi:hypothetical protein
MCNIGIGLVPCTMYPNPCNGGTCQDDPGALKAYRCSNCSGNQEGDYCDTCKQGYMTEESSTQSGSETVYCGVCAQGYEGSSCERCGTGYRTTASGCTLNALEPSSNPKPVSGDTGSAGSATFPAPGPAPATSPVNAPGQAPAPALAISPINAPGQAPAPALDISQVNAPNAAPAAVPALSSEPGPDSNPLSNPLSNPATGCTADESSQLGCTQEAPCTYDNNYSRNVCKCAADGSLLGWNPGPDQVNAVTGKPSGYLHPGACRKMCVANAGTVAKCDPDSDCPSNEIEGVCCEPDGSGCNPVGCTAPLMQNLVSAQLATNGGPSECGVPCRNSDFESNGEFTVCDSSSTCVPGPDINTPSKCVCSAAFGDRGARDPAKQCFTDLARIDCSANPCTLEHTVSCSDNTSIGFVCVCKAGYKGATCDECTDGAIREGNTCYVCPSCDHGTQAAVTLLIGSPPRSVCTCQCGIKYSGGTCSSCTSAYGKVDAFTQAVMNCDECAKGYARDGDLNDCTACNSNGVQGKGCGDQGTCEYSQTQEKPVCVCAEGFEGPYCNTITPMPDPCSVEPLQSSTCCSLRGASRVGPRWSDGFGWWSVNRSGEGTFLGCAPVPMECHGEFDPNSPTLIIVPDADSGSVEYRPDGTPDFRRLLDHGADYEARTPAFRATDGWKRSFGGWNTLVWNWLPFARIRIQNMGGAGIRFRE